ncbi:MAG: ribosome biogenesis GTPase Der [Pantoea sp. Brub]|nr:ribosome biogenesis GTPase Der [Pantoea sp. Brub]
MIPIIALIGRCNVGKSTLFNRLSNSKDALVLNCPGLTRDRKYSKVKCEKYEFILIDTGGIDKSKNCIELQIHDQSLIAIEEADIILFMVDGRVGLIDDDQKIAKYLHVSKKSVFVVINKIDALDTDLINYRFCSLGFKNIYNISATSGRGINELIKQVFSLQLNINLTKKNTHTLNIISKDKEQSTQIKNNLCDVSIKLAIVGRPNVGKSTLINYITGTKRVIVSKIPGTTRDSIYVPVHYNHEDYILIDTAGVCKKQKINSIVEKFSIIKTFQAIQDANVVILIIDGSEGLVHQDLWLLEFIIHNGRSLVIAVNKSDNIIEKDLNDLKSTLAVRLNFIYLKKIHFISALYGKGLKKLFYSVKQTYNCTQKQVSTSFLTNIMHKAIANHKPPLIYHNAIKMKYAHVGGYNPLIIIIHGNRVSYVPHSYKRYLLKYFSHSINLLGCPIFIQFKEGVNPYKKKFNISVFKKTQK